MARRLAWGILGTGNIAGKFAKDLATIPARGWLRSVGSRSGDTARAFATTHAAESFHGDYQGVLDDPAVDAVYISLLNHQHAHWAIRCAQAGKHILCEKPATMHEGEITEVIAAVRAKGVFFMEAFAYRCHPRWRRLIRMIKDGAIGAVRMLHSTFAFDGAALGRPRLHRRDWGGGALMDVGVYPLSWIRGVCGTEPVAHAAHAHLGPDGVDAWTSGSLAFANGAVAGFATAINCVQPNVARVCGETGILEAVEPWRCAPGKSPLILRRSAGGEEQFNDDDGLALYAREAVTVADHCTQGQADACTWQDSIDQARLVDALRHDVGVWWDGEVRPSKDRPGLT